MKGCLALSSKAVNLFLGKYSRGTPPPADLDTQTRMFAAPTAHNFQKPWGNQCSSREKCRKKEPGYKTIW